MKINDLTCTSDACPTQYEGFLDDGRMVYIRYRWGYLSIRVSLNSTENVMVAVSSPEIYGEQLGDCLDGHLDHERLIEILNNIEYPPSKED